MKIATAPCPICSSEGTLTRTLTADFIAQQLQLFFDKEVPDLGITDYQMIKCKSCSLEYATPLQPGSDLFYEWITNQPDYYIKYRWEWGTVIEQMRKHRSEKISVLEVGCGLGKFLEAARQIPNTRAVGLDTTMTSVEKCQAKGLEVYCETLESFLASRSIDEQRFDFLVAFHCLEHVSDPKGLIKSMLSALKPTGSIFVSTPYSPMSIESLWFDPRNHPPHHMTRWNVSSYRELARQLGLKINLFMPTADKALTRVVIALNYAWNGHAHLASRQSVKRAALKHPLVTIAEWFRQSRREKVNNQVAADEVLVEFTY